MSIHIRVVKVLKSNMNNIPPKMRCNGDALCAEFPRNETTSYSNYQESRFAISQRSQSGKWTIRLVKE